MKLPQWLGNRKQMFAWGAAGSGIFILCLIATFPYEALHARLTEELHGATGIEARVAEWSVDWPSGIEWRQVTLAKPEWDPIQVAALHAKVGLLKALGGGLGVDLAVRFDDASPAAGRADATLSASSWSLEAPVSVTGRLQQIDLSRVLRRYITHGMLNANFSQRIDSGRPESGFVKGEGTWNADASDIAVDHIPLGNGRTLSLTFTKVSAGVTCRDSVCTITELKGDGADGSFTGEGTITLEQPILNSQLALTVTIVPGAGFVPKAGTLGLPPLPVGTPLTVKIVGPLAQARIAL
jgi:type II secretion system protein N